MCESTGLRKCVPVIRFQDEFGSLGSCPTPIKMQRKVYSDLFSSMTEPRCDLATILYETMSDKCHRKIQQLYRSNDSKYELFDEIRFAYLNFLESGDFPELSDEFKIILAHYALFAKDSFHIHSDVSYEYRKYALYEFQNATIIQMNNWSISTRNMVKSIYRAMVSVWRRDMELMGLSVCSQREYIRSMRLKLNNEPKLVQRIPPSALEFIANATGTQIYMAKLAHPVYD